MFAIKPTSRDIGHVAASSSRDASFVVTDAALMSRPEVAALLPPLDLLVRDLNSRFDSFPHSCCEFAAERVSRLGLGLSYVNGIYTQGNAGHSHAWNMSSELGVYVDVTARQFSQALPAILIIPIGSDFAQRHYLQDWHIAW